MRLRWIGPGLLLLTTVVLAQRFGGIQFSGHDEGPAPTFPAHAEFHFVRLEYTDLPQFHRNFGFGSRTGRGEGWWLVDWPDADDHFSAGVDRLTRLSTGEPRHLRLTDEHLFEYPWVYATQTGWWGLSDAETRRLREYLLRGGFLMVDDMWGPGNVQWDVFVETMRRVMPEAQITQTPESDPAMHALYDIQEKDRSFIPGTRHLRRGAGGTVVVQQPAGTAPQWMRIADSRDRMFVAVNFNTDIGDAWEYADAPEYPEHMTALAYRYGINYLVYSMTH